MFRRDHRVRLVFKSSRFRIFDRTDRTDMGAKRFVIFDRVIRQDKATSYTMYYPPAPASPGVYLALAIGCGTSSGGATQIGHPCYLGAHHNSGTYKILVTRHHSHTSHPPVLSTCQASHASLLVEK
jgi:hypothetical protein